MCFEKSCSNVICKPETDSKNPIFCVADSQGEKHIKYIHKLDLKDIAKKIHYKIIL